MALLVGAWGTLAIWFGERIGINSGEGWDGIAYTQWAQSFAKVLHDGLTRYHAQRVLPSAAIDVALRVAGKPHDVAHVLNAFAIANVVLLAGSAVLWAHLAAVMRWSRISAWVGFFALFVTFVNAKHATYYPALTDTTAFALGMLMIWAYLTERPIALWVAAAAGMVTWPALPPLALALLLLPRSKLAGTPASRLERGLAVGAAVSVAAAFVVAGFYYLHSPVPGVGDEKFAEWVPRGLLVVTVPTLVAVLALGTYFVVAPVRLAVLLEYLRALSRRRLAIVLVAAIALYVARAVYLAKVGTQGEGPTGAQFACEHTLAALRGPLWGLVHHVVYFGPIIAVAILAWRRVGATVWSWGPAATIGLAMVVVFAAGSNSRQWLHLLPLLVAATIAATDSLWTRNRLFGFAALSLVWSKVWFHLGYDTVLDWHTFPNQRYFMNTGPYAANTPYLVHLIAGVTTTVLLWWMLRDRAFSAAPASSENA